MAQTRNKRRRKHRGTPAGTIERPGRTGSSRVQQDAKEIARERRAARLDREPTWRSAVTRAAIAAVVFGVVVTVFFERNVVRGVTLAAFMFLLYIPFGYLTDRAIYNFRRRKRG
jgi:hypothetical protein